MPNSAKGIPDRSQYGDETLLTEGSLADFIEQLHEAEKAGTHTDIRLGTPETGLLSWAIRKGLPTKNDGHLAVRQPIHEYEYGDFSGTIPKGQYGAGKVTKVGKRKVLITEIKKGKIAFTVSDGRKQERYMLIRPNNWNVDHWLMFNVSLDKPLDIDKLSYKQIPAGQLDKALDMLKDEKGSAQAKVDGAHVLLNVLKHGVEAFSPRKTKEGKPIVYTEKLFGTKPYLDIPKEFRDSVLVGEAYAVNNDKVLPVQDLAGFLNTTVPEAITRRQKGFQTRLGLFDVRRLKGNDIDISKVPYSQRRKILEQILPYLPEQSHIMPEVKTNEEARQLWDQIRKGENVLTREGLVIFPEKGKPVKIKLFEEKDVYATGMLPGKGKYKNKAIGGFTYSTIPGGPTVGKVGTGFSDALREDMYNNPELYLDKIFRVRHQGEFPSGALRTPALISEHLG